MSLEKVPASLDILGLSNDELIALQIVAMSPFVRDLDMLVHLQKSHGTAKILNLALML